MLLPRSKLGFCPRGGVWGVVGRSLRGREENTREIRKRLLAGAGESLFLKQQRRGIGERFLKRFSAFGMRLVVRMVRLLAVLGVVILVIAGGSIYFWWKTVSGPVDLNDHEEVAIAVSKGASAAEVGRILWKAGIIRDPFVFRVASHLWTKQATIMPGDYLLSKDRTLGQVFETLVKGPRDVWVTIPEGWRREQIAVRLDEFLNGGKIKKFDSKRFLSLTEGLEGRLFPDTYLIPQDSSEEVVVKIMLDNFRKRTAGVLVPPFPSGLTDREVIILSSIVERETSGNVNERAIVAGILLKRFGNNWPLQTDATLQYMRDSMAIANGFLGFKFWQPLTGSEKTLDSPFNTYLHLGMTPMAISNPGLSAIKAVLSPRETNYWYYLHSTDGTIHFATTAQEHQQNIAKYL